MDAGFGFFETPKTTNPADNSLSPSWVGEGQGEGGRALISYHPPYHQCRLKYCTSRSCFSAASRVWNVPRLRRLPVFGSTLREYRRYPPAASLRIMATFSLPISTSTFAIEKKSRVTIDLRSADDQLASRLPQVLRILLEQFRQLAFDLFQRLLVIGCFGQQIGEQRIQSTHADERFGLMLGDLQCIADSGCCGPD